MHKARVSRIRKLFRSAKQPSALLLSSAPQIIQSRDEYYPYRQDSDFYYLTGSRDIDLTLLISSTDGAVLYAPKPNPHKILWDGKPVERPADVAKRIGAEFIQTDNPKLEIRARLRKIDELYYQNLPQTTSWSIAKQLIETQSDERRGIPSTYHHSDKILEGMRLYKEPGEVKLITKALQVGHRALLGAIPLMHAGAKENEVGAAIEYLMRVQGAEVAFPPIVASGPNGAVLHHRKLRRTIKKDDTLLLDWGAAHEMYCGDLTRVLPVSGTFSPIQRALYEIVLEANKAAIKKVKNNVLIRTVYLAAAKVLTEGLVDLGVLRGKVSALMAKEAYKPYFPHGIGHSLGIDTHDIGKLRGNNAAVLKTGMVFTIEPGLYFPEKVRKIMPIGIRVEDNVLVTARGCKVLSDFVPKEAEEIEELMAG